MAWVIKTILIFDFHTPKRVVDIVCKRPLKHRNRIYEMFYIIDGTIHAHSESKCLSTIKNYNL